MAASTSCRGPLPNEGTPRMADLRQEVQAAAEAIARAWGYDSIAEVESVHDGEAESLWSTAAAAAPAVLLVAAVHAQELADKLTHIAPDLAIGIVKAERDEHHYADVVIASIQTIARPKRIAPLVDVRGLEVMTDPRRVRELRDAGNRLQVAQEDRRRSRRGARLHRLDVE